MLIKHLKLHVPQRAWTVYIQWNIKAFEIKLKTNVHEFIFKIDPYPFL